MFFLVELKINLFCFLSIFACFYVVLIFHFFRWQTLLQKILINSNYIVYIFLLRVFWILSKTFACNCQTFHPMYASHHYMNGKAHFDKFLDPICWFFFYWQYFSGRIFFYTNSKDVQGGVVFYNKLFNRVEELELKMFKL